MDPIPEEVSKFYSQLEQINTFDKWELIKQLTPLSEIYTDYWKDALITERLALNFMLKEGLLKPIYSSITEDGKEVGFPLISDFSKDANLYLNQRAQSTKNYVLIARYNHILEKLEALTTISRSDNHIPQFQSQKKDDSWSSKIEDFTSDLIKIPAVKIGIYVVGIVAGIYILGLVAKIIGKSIENINYMTNAMKNG
jgi:hypothetical protein